MTDLNISLQRHANMAAIHDKGTKPEILVRKWLWKHGYRYRLNYNKLPGKPDIVMRKYRTCIFINGCFWHGHIGCKYYTVPKTNTDFWISKISKNQQHDLEVLQKLASLGWHTIIIWGCELKPKVRQKTLESLTYTLNKIYLQDRSIHRYKKIEDDHLIAAEPSDRE